MQPDDTADRILSAAMQLWAEKGYEAATMRELARRVGMGASTLYRSFESKEAIVLHFYQRLNQQVGAEFDQQGASGDVGADLQRYLRLKLALLEPHRSAFAGLLREAIDPGSRLSPLQADSEGTMRDNVHRFAGWVEGAGAASGAEAEDLGRALWLVHIAVIVFWLYDRSEAHVATQAAIARVGGLSGLLPFARAMPQFGEGLALLRALFQPPEPSAPEPRAKVGREVDVVVVGGGPIGCLFAGFLKQLRPRSRVLVLEREAVPGHKVGESTLSGFCKALRTLGIRQEALRTLFQAKNGLGFSWVEQGHSLGTAPEYVLETFDETFQVERRVLDALVLAQVRRMGVEVIQGATVDLQDLHLQAEQCRVSYKVGRTSFTVGARQVVDATGPAASIARSKGLWSDDGIAFQTSAVWGWFEGATPLSAQAMPGTTQFSRDEYTWHLCGRPGWVWVIPQVSWADAPDSNLHRGLDSLLSAGRLPDRGALEQQGNPVGSRVSVGLVVRNDRDVLGLSSDPAAAFAAARKRWPALEELLAGATPVDMGKGPFEHRKNMRGHAREVAGDGWCAVGDAAFFVDPLISPGLTAGAATAWQAAHALAEALDDQVRADSLSAYQAFTRRLHGALEADNQLVYHSFDHPDLMALVQRFQEITARQHFLAGDDTYGEADTNVWGILDDTYGERQRALLALLRDHAAAVDASVPVDEQTLADHAPAVAQARALLGDWLAAHTDLNPYLQGNPEVS